MRRNAKDCYRMVVCTYEPVPLRMSKVLEAQVGGIEAVMEKGYNYLVPFFIVMATRQSYAVDHDMPQQKGEKNTLRHRKQRPTMVVTEIEDLFQNDDEFDPDEYLGPVGITKLVERCKSIDDPEDPAYGLRLGVNQIDYTALKRSESPEAIAEKNARDTVKNASDLTGELVDARLKLAKSEEMNGKMMSVMEKMEARLAVLEKADVAPEPTVEVEVVSPPAEVEEAPVLTKQQKAAATRKAKKEAALQAELEE